MRIALAQINPTVGDFSGNLARISEGVQRAADAAVDLVIFPELATSGYPPADLLEKTSFVRRAEESLAAIADLTRGKDRPAVLCGSPMHCDGPGEKRVRNVAAVLEDGELRFLQQKMLLPFYDVFDEQRYFEPAKHQALTLIKGQPVAITICEDAWNDKMFWPRQNYPLDPVEELMKQWGGLPQTLSGQRLILNISASPYWHGKTETRRRMIGALARRHGATVVMVNQVGANDSLIFDGDSFAMNPAGEIIAQAEAFREDFVVVEISSARPLQGALVHSAAEAKGPAECERTWQALVLGTRDYLGKCGFQKAILGLSGGIDSALVATIAVEALGAENVQGIGMPSEFSSNGSVADAELLASNLGIAFSVLPIREIYDEFTHRLQPFFAGTPFGLAEENVQPRIRGTLLMAVSNKVGALVLTTGNKSEMATGYSTLYGDMVGALAVIGDLYKTEIYALCRWINRDREIIPSDTLTKPPSAELRHDQKDTDSLPEYEVLDPILRAYIEEYTPAEQIAEDLNIPLELVRKVIRLVEIAEYKRQQAAPVLKVSKKAFGMGRRFPIAARREI
ncbi:MAG: NAD+ synthase [Janthinobacterium lividum]